MSTQQSPSEIPAPLVPIVASITALVNFYVEIFHRIPGSPIVLRYIKSSYQNDPWRSLLEVLLVAFALRTVLKGRTRGDGQSKNFIKFSEKEIDDLVDEWQPVSLVDDPTEFDQNTADSVPTIQGSNGLKVRIQPNGKLLTNLATPNWTGLIENDSMKQVAVDTLKEYGVGTCGPAGFYGFMDVHAKFETDVAEYLGTEAAIVYSQAFSAVSSVIPAFAKRGDIIVADRGVNFAIHKGLQISRSNVRWFAHGDMEDLERVLQVVDREMKRKKAKLTRRFIVAEGVFENDGMMLDLPKVMELKNKYKYRLILDESQSFGMIGDHGRGITEYYNVPARDVDILVGSMANGLAAGGGFVAGSSVVCTHQRINSSASVFSASLPAMLATTSSHALSILSSSPALFNQLRTNITTFRATLAKLEQEKDAIISIPSHPDSGLIHIFLLNPPENMVDEEQLLQRVVDEAIEAHGVLITRARRLRGQEAFEPEPSLKVCISGALPKKDVEKAAMGLKAALVKICGKKR